jgi:hypothetical protein
MNTFLHSKSDPAVALIAPEQTVEGLLAEHGDSELWLENADEPLPRATKLADLPPGSHITRSSCVRVGATVRFNEEKKTKEFPPGTTVARVFEWAAGNDGFDLPAGQRPKHTLAICGTTTQPEKSTHLGELADDSCSVCFDLAPKERFEG